jgi:hypothetical protein
MNRHLQFLAIVAALAAPCGVAQAQTLDATKIASITQASDAFVALAKGSHTTGKPPRQTDAAAKPLLDTVFNTKDIEGDKPLPWSDIKLLEQWNGAAVKIGLVYYLAGTGAADLPALSQDAQAMNKANRNTVEFAPEFGRYSDAQIRIHAALVDAALAQMAAATPEQNQDPEFRNTLNNISQGTAEAITGLLGSMVLDGMTDAWLLGRVVVLLEITPKAAKFMSPGDRQRVKTVAAEVADHLKNPDVKSGVNAIARGLELLGRSY